MKRRNKNQIKAAKIADAVLWAVNSGKDVVPCSQWQPCTEGSLDKMCPLGALEFSAGGLRYPTRISLLTDNETTTFIRAFDDGIETISFWSHLGILYRRWSQRKYGWSE
jgi:hypothetical protein